jgi:NAD(P)-dependent dehydrogenase (short-subunit alcohol dehydrogenase family)
MSTPVVLITGALTGIGRAAAFALAREGSRVVVSGRHEEVGQALAAELRGLGGELNSSVPTCAAKTMCAAWSIRPSRASVI